MSRYLWRDEYSIGNGEIDGQHRRLFELLDGLYQAVCAGEGDPAVRAVLDELIGYTQEHFYAEEGLMQELGYPGLKQHQAEHQDLLAKVQLKINALERGEKVSSIELLEFMHLWLSDHIMTSDRQMAGFCQGN